MLNDWRLTYDGVDFSFGTIASKFVFPQDGPPSVSNIDIDDEDTRRPQADGLMFGQDFRGGTTITFDIEIHGETESEALTLLQSLAQVWSADNLRGKTGALAMLTAHTGRTAFGRPRRFQPKLDLLPFGIVAVTCDFVTMDTLWYGAEQSSTVKFVPDLGGGLVAPLQTPLSTTATSDRSQTVSIGGTQSTWPTFFLSGPITNPEIEIDGQFKLAYQISLAADETLVIDTRPTARTSTVNDSSVAGTLLARYSRLSDAYLRPGRYDVALRGMSSSGTAELTITWRDTFPSL